MNGSASSEKYTDCHVHLAALPDGENGCHISRKMLRSPLFRFLLWKHDLPTDDPRRANQKYVDDLLAELLASRYTAKAVLLAMDGVYDDAGRLDIDQTDFLIDNNYVLNVAKAYPEEFLAGVSINPQRRDAVDEVHRCADAGEGIQVESAPETGAALSEQGPWGPAPRKGKPAATRGRKASALTRVSRAGRTAAERTQEHGRVLSLSNLESDFPGDASTRPCT